MDTPENHFAWLDLIPTPCLIQRLEDNQLVYVNPAAFGTLGIPKANWKGTQLTDLFTLGKRGNSGIWHRDGKRYHIQEQRVDIQNTSYKQLLITPIQPPIGDKQLADAQRMAGVLVHRLRSPLNGVIGFTDMLQEEQLEDQQAQPSWASIQKGLHTMKQLLDELNRFTESIEVQQEQISLSQLIDQLTQQLPGKRTRRLTINYMAQPEQVRGDSIHLQFILNELLNNAFEASDDELDSVELTVDASSLHITNKGIKLSQEERQHLFEPFYTTKARHLGLGLTQAWRYAHAMGWNLYYESDSNSTTHTFTLIW